MSVYAHKKLSPHFSLYEFTVSRTAQVLGIDNTPDFDALESLKIVAQQMEEVRRRLRNNPIIVTSGYRSPKLNAATPGSSRNSHHTMGWAVDFICPGYGSPVAVAKRIYEEGQPHGKSVAKPMLSFDQLIYEYGWVHLSFHPLRRGHVMTIRPGEPAMLGIVDLENSNA